MMTSEGCLHGMFQCSMRWFKCSDAASSNTSSSFGLNCAGDSSPGANCGHQTRQLQQNLILVSFTLLPKANIGSCLTHWSSQRTLWSLWGSLLEPARLSPVVSCHIRSSGHQSQFQVLRSASMQNEDLTFIRLAKKGWAHHYTAARSRATAGPICAQVTCHSKRPLLSHCVGDSKSLQAHRTTCIAYPGRFEYPVVTAAHRWRRPPSQTCPGAPGR